MRRPCLYCGQLTHNQPATCTNCAAIKQQQAPRKPTPPKPSSTARGYGYAWRKIRTVILERDGHRCYLCGGPARSVDHIVSKARGGTDDAWNLAACCSACQNRKGDQGRRRRA